MPCPVLSCPVLSCPVLSCPVLSCPVLSIRLFPSPDLRARYMTVFHFRAQPPSRLKRFDPNPRTSVARTSPSRGGGRSPGKPRQKLLLGYRTAEEIALEAGAPALLEDPLLRLCFDPFGHDLKRESLRQDDDGGDDRPVFPAFPKPLHEGAVDLDLIERIFLRDPPPSAPPFRRGSG